jgi:hypothetical protein
MTATTHCILLISENILKNKNILNTMRITVDLTCHHWCGSETNLLDTDLTLQCVQDPDPNLEFPVSVPDPTLIIYSSSTIVYR